MSEPRKKSGLVHLVTRFFVGMTKKARWVVLAYIATRLLAILLFSPLEHWSLLDAYWWGEAASLTIGYGDLSPKTAVGRLLATPFHFFWVYYCGLALGAHIIMYLIRNEHVLTHHEQEWLFRVVTVTCERVGYIAKAQYDISRAMGLGLNRPPHSTANGTPLDVDEQPADRDYTD